MNQADAYRTAGPGDWATDPVLAGCVVHDPGTPPDRTPQEWDATGWDAAQTGPKTLIEAQAALAARITDPAAPDDETALGAYDGGL